MAEAIDLSRKFFNATAVVPHYTLPAGRRDAVIAAGAVALADQAFNNRVRAINQKSQPDTHKTERSLWRPRKAKAKERPKPQSTDDRQASLFARVTTGTVTHGRLWDRC